jgi:hypothetical protein
MGDQDDVVLVTTTMSDLSRAKRFLLCVCMLRYSRFYLEDYDVVCPLQPLRCVLDRNFVREACRIQLSRNNNSIHSIVSHLCRTPRVSNEIVQNCIPQKPPCRVVEMACGGMSRIYAFADDRPVVIKVTDCSRGVGRYELECYKYLKKHGFETPSIRYAAMYGSLKLFIMDRQHFNLTTALIAISRDDGNNNGKYMDCIMHNVKYLLLKLRINKISFCDFSPDNITVRVGADGTSDLLLIDPQFCIDTDLLSKKTGRHWAHNIDRVHFAYKVRALAIGISSMHAVSDRVCMELLGRIPTEKETRRWLLKTLPDGMRIAYDTVCQMYGK